MDKEALLYQIALPLLPDVGLHWARQLVSCFGSAEAVFRVTREDLQELPNVQRHFVDSLLAGREEALKRAEEEVRFVRNHAIHTYWYEDDNYPDALRQLPDAPLLLYGKGNLSFDGPMISIVGTRMPSDRGRQACREFVLDLAKKMPNITIVSGLAYGIDVEAHKAAIEAGVSTIIVPAHGLDRIYPAIHRNVAVQALEKGGILTEYMSQTEPEKPHFVARNRIVAGLSVATVVIESKAKGGSLITANMARDYNRDVFAMPGRAADIQSAGCNALIRRNIAGLICSADDLIEEMGWQKKEPQQTSMTFVDLSKDEEQIMQLLDDEGVHINTLCEQSGKSFMDVSDLLFSMELKGVVRALPGSRYRK